MPTLRSPRAWLWFATLTLGLTLIVRLWFAVSASSHSLLNLLAMIGWLVVTLAMLPAPPPFTTREASKSRWIAIAVGVAVLLHARVLTLPLVADDHYFAYLSRHLDWLEWMPRARFDWPFFRPLGLATFFVEGRIDHFHPVAAHAVNWAIHAINVVLIVVCAKRYGLGIRTGLFAAAIFASHPLTNEPVGWLACRFDLVATLFTLGGLWFLRGTRLVDSAMTSALFACGALCKESAFVAPFLGAALLFLIPISPRQIIHRFVLPSLTVASVVIGRSFYLGFDASLGYAVEWTMAGVFKRIFRATWPLVIGINWTEASLIALSALLLTLGFWLILLWTPNVKARESRLLLAATLLATAPVFPLLLLDPDLANSRFFYLPLVPFALLIGRHVAAHSRPMLLLSTWLLASTLALQVNYDWRLQASLIAQEACAAVRPSPNATGVRVIGLPAKLFGIAVLRNAFGACVEAASSFDANLVNIAEKPSTPVVGLEQWIWNPANLRLEKYSAPPPR